MRGSAFVSGKTLMEIKQNIGCVLTCHFLTHSTHLWAGLERKPFENIAGKGQIAFTCNFSFSQMFSTLSKTDIIIFVTSNLSSANAFNFFGWEWVKNGPIRTFLIVLYLEAFEQYCLSDQKLCFFQIYKILKKKDNESF